MKKENKVLLLLLVFICMMGCQPNVNQNQDAQGNESPESTNSAEAPSDIEDADILQMLNDYLFFIGDVMIDEEQKWQSKYQDASHGEGNAQLAVNELIAYDPETQKAYIIARTLKFESQHMVTVNDINGNFAGRSPIDASGELTECYGLGQNQGGKLDFSGLPVRMDQIETTFYTHPATHNSQWVAFRSIADTVRWSVERIGPPDTALDPQLQQITLLDTIANTKTYGNLQSAMYEATRRLWQVKGTVDYSYSKISSVQALDYLKTKLNASKVTEGFTSPLVLNSLGGDYLKIWEALDQIARYSHQSLSAGQSILFMPVTYPEDIIHVNRDKLSEALAQLAEIGKHGSVFGLFPEGQSFTAQLIASVDALKAAENDYLGLSGTNSKNKEALESALRPFLAYLLRYEDAVLGLMDLPENERTTNVQKEIIGTLLAGGFSDEGLQALDMEAEVEVPEGYPLAVLPLPDHGRLVLAEVIETGGFNLTFVDPTTEAELVEKYVALLSSRSEYNLMKIQGMTILTANQSPWTMSVTIGTNQLTEEGGMMINLTVVPLE